MIPQVRELGASYSLCGYTVAINVLLELPIFWAGGWLLRSRASFGVAIVGLGGLDLGVVCILAIAPICAVARCRRPSARPTQTGASAATASWRGWRPTAPTSSRLPASAFPTTQTTRRA